MVEQKGGLEPASAALIALLGVGGVGAYGASAMNKNAAALLDEKSGGIISQLKSITTNLTSERDALRKEVERLKADIQRKEFEVNKKAEELKAQQSKIGELESGTGPALVFKNATTETLERAIPVTIRKLGEFATGKPGYEWLLDETKLKNIVDALEYPTTYQGKLMRLTLPALYEKRIKKAAQIDYDLATRKGGKRRRRGGDEPAVTPAFPFPTYEEFAKLYSEAINQVSLTGVQEIAKKSTEFRKAVDEKAQARRNETSRKAAITLADSLQKVIQKAKKDIEQYPSSATPELRSDVEKDITEAEGQVTNLREITTEENWNNIKGTSQSLKDSIPKKVKEYIQQAKVEPSPEYSDSIHKEILTTTPTYIQTLKDRINTLETLWYDAKKARDSICKAEGKLLDYKGGPEAYENITNLMTEGKSTIESMKQLLKEFEAFNKEYTEATRDIKFVSNRSFVLSPSEEPDTRKEEIERRKRIAEQEDEERRPSIRNIKKEFRSPSMGGAFKELVDLRNRYNDLVAREKESLVPFETIQRRIKKNIQKLEESVSKGPMSSFEQSEEEKEREIRQEFRSTPLPTECTPIEELSKSLFSLPTPKSLFRKKSPFTKSPSSLNRSFTNLFTRKKKSPFTEPGPGSARKNTFKTRRRRRTNE